jgi:hypothetical protein
MPDDVADARFNLDDRAEGHIDCRVKGCDMPLLEHDPEKWIPVFGKDHASPKCQSGSRFDMKRLRSGEGPAGGQLVEPS